MKLRGWIIVLSIIALANVLAQVWIVRLDMTDDKHYSLNEATKQLLRQTDEPIEVTLLLGGDLNAGFRRLKKATEETLEEMSVYSDVKVIKDIKNLKEVESIGLKPIVIHEREQNGKTAQTTVYPYALVRYKEKKGVVTLLKNTRGLSGEENLNASIENLEFAFAEVLHLLQQTETPRVAFLEGHGEIDEAHTYDLMTALSRYFQVDRGTLDGETIDIHMLDGYQALIIADPQSSFSDRERFIIDQYIMRGGSVLWAINGVRFSEDVLQRQGFTPILALDLGLTDMLFRYGIRINPALVQDIQCLPIPVNVSNDPHTPNLQPVPWTYAPLLLTSQGSPITRNLGQVSSTFVSPIDAVGGEDGIEKRVLLATSTATKVTGTPSEVDLSDVNPAPEDFKYQYVPVAVSMEGVFPSAFTHRMMPEGITSDEAIRRESAPTRQAVFAYGSILGNDLQQGQPLPMGYDRYSGMQFSNRDVIVNTILWLTDSEGLIALREKNVTLRLLNDKRAHDERMQVQIISTITPIAILTLIGGLVWIIRKKKYETI